jgi:Spy/CpxP family protein refolding chaperone
LKPWVSEFEQQRVRLNKMTAERLASETAYSLQVSRYEALRSRLAETRAVMLYRMYQELSPEQYKKLQDMTREWASGRGPGPGPKQ